MYETARRDYRISLVDLEADAHVPAEEQVLSTDTSVQDTGPDDSQQETRFLLRYCAGWAG